MRDNLLLQGVKDFILVHLSTFLTSKKDQKLPKEIFNLNRVNKISYCTTCMGRTFHLKKTYVKNILENINYPNLEFVLLNYNSNDDLDEWVNSDLKEYIDRGIVKYYKTTLPQEFHMSKAKNLSHRLATGDILVNLDADNYLGKNNAFYTNYLFNEKGLNKLFQFTKRSFKYFDTCGRIAIKKNDFMKIGGYREDLLAYGEEDLDLLRRAKVAGIDTNTIEIINFLRTIKHTNQLRKANINTTLDLKSMKKFNIDLVNKVIDDRISFLANKDGFTKFKVYKNNSNKGFII